MPCIVNAEIYVVLVVIIHKTPDPIPITEILPETTGHWLQKLLQFKFDANCIFDENL